MDGMYYDVYYGTSYQGTVRDMHEFTQLMDCGQVCMLNIDAGARRICVDREARRIGQFDADQSGGYIVIDKAD